MEWVCFSSLAATVGSNPTGFMDVCCECWVLSGRESSLRGADHLSIEVLHCAMCMSVIMRRTWPPGGGGGGGGGAAVPVGVGGGDQHKKQEPKRETVKRAEGGV